MTFFFPWMSNTDWFPVLEHKHCCPCLLPTMAKCQNKTSMSKRQKREPTLQQTVNIHTNIHVFETITSLWFCLVCQSFNINIHSTVKVYDHASWSVSDKVLTNTGDTTMFITESKKEIKSDRSEFCYDRNKGLTSTSASSWPFLARYWDNILSAWVSASVLASNRSCRCCSFV